MYVTKMQLSESDMIKMTISRLLRNHIAMGEIRQRKLSNYIINVAQLSKLKLGRFEEPRQKKKKDMVGINI